MFPVGLLRTPTGKVDSDFAAFIAANRSKHWFVAVSNNPKPDWFEREFGANVVFQMCNRTNGGPRQTGGVVQGLLDANQAKHNLQKSQVVIFGYGELDVPMYANSQSVLVRCDWRSDVHPKIRPYGIPCPEIGLLPHILTLLNEEHPWHFTHTHSLYDTYCLTNAATRKGSDAELKALAEKLQGCLKAGDPKNRWDFMVHLLSSLYATPIFRTVDLWGYYPSAASKNEGKEVIADFAEIARTTFKRRKKDHPLIIRHTPTYSRHRGPQSDRDDPAQQIETIHLHPDYKGALSGKTVAVLDDYTTHGVSFSVAAAFLRKAGVAKVVAIAIGKFPRTSYVQEIQLGSDPFAPVTKFQVVRRTPQEGTEAPDASGAFKRKFQ